MTEALILISLLVVLVAAAAAFALWLRASSNKRLSAGLRKLETQSTKFRDNFFKTLASVQFETNPDKCLDTISDGISLSFDSDTFILRRSDTAAQLVAYSSARTDEISTALQKSGIRFDAHKIPISGERAKLFETGFIEAVDIFPLIDDLVTVASARKLQHDLKFASIVSASVKTDTDNYLVFLLLPVRIPGLKFELGQFLQLIRLGLDLTQVRQKLKGFEERFDEQFISARNELKAKESAHLAVFSEMTIPAALIDERGVITEANDALAKIFPEGTKPVGQALSMVLDEENRRHFLEVIMTASSKADAETNVKVGGKSFKVHVVPPKLTVDGPRNIAVYFVDETPIVNLRQELERTIDSLKSDNQHSSQMLTEEKDHASDMIRNAPFAVLKVVEGNINVYSGAAASVLKLSANEPLADFISTNGFVQFPESEGSFETTDGEGRTFAVDSWNSAGSSLYAFRELTESKEKDRTIASLSLDSDKLFDGTLPTAAVKDNLIVRWNTPFGNLFGEIVSSDKTLEGFLRYLGEPPGAFLAELQTSGTITRDCRTKDKKYLDVRAVRSTGNAAFVFVTDLTEQENAKQALRATQNLLSNAVESFSDEPFFIVESGMVTAANMAARTKLNLKLDEPFDGAAVLSTVGFSSENGTVELGGIVHRMNTSVFGNATVYRFEEMSQQIEHLSEIERLKIRQGIVRDMSTSSQYEELLANLFEIVKNDKVENTRLICTGVVQTSKDLADVYLLAVQEERTEPALTLSLTSDDLFLLERGGSFAKEELPDSTFMNVISGNSARLMLASSSAGDSRGFASIAFQVGEISGQVETEVTSVLETGSSVALSIATRVSAERKFESTDKVTRALVGLTGIGEDSFDEAARKYVDLLRHVFSTESVGIYVASGATLSQAAINGSLPSTLSVPNLRFGSLVTGGQLEGDEQKSSEGFYFAVKSRKQNLALVFKIIGIPPAPSELNAIGSIALDLLEARKGSEIQSQKTGALQDESRMLNDYMVKLARATKIQEVIDILRATLADRYPDVKVNSEDTYDDSIEPLALAEKADPPSFRANFSNFGFGILTVKCVVDQFSRGIVGSAVDKIRSLLAAKLPAAQRENEVIRMQLDRTKTDYSTLQESVDKVPAAMRHARIEIDNVLSRLPFVQGEENLMQEIKLHLASAAKEISFDMDSSTRNQDEIFAAVRMAVMERGETSGKFKDIDISVLTEFRVPAATFDMLKDLFVNFIVIAAVNDSEISMMTAQPSPGEAASGKGKHISVRITAPHGNVYHDDAVNSNSSIKTLMNDLSKLGYDLDTRALGNELTLDVCEIKSIDTSQQQSMSALLVEDDKVLAYDESQKLIRLFSLLKVAGDAVEAAMVLDSASFNIAFVDLSLPSINGKELCQQIKQSQPGCVTVLLTNREGEERSEGVDHIMQRPIDETVVRKYLKL